MQELVIFYMFLPQHNFVKRMQSETDIGFPVPYGYIRIGKLNHIQ